MPNDELEILWIKSVNIIKPGTMKAPYGTPSISAMRVPMADPKTTKYSDVEITGETIVCNNVRFVRAISNL